GADPAGLYSGTGGYGTMPGVAFPGEGQSGDSQGGQGMPGQGGLPGGVIATNSGEGRKPVVRVVRWVDVTAARRLKPKAHTRCRMTSRVAVMMMWWPDRYVKPQ